MDAVDKKLLTMVEKGDSEAVIELIHSGANPNCQSTNGYSALMLAVRAWEVNSERKFKVTKILLEYGADPSYISPDGYQAVTLTYDMDIVRLLIESGVKVTAETATRILYNGDGNRQIRKLFDEKGIQTQWKDSPRQIYNRIREYTGFSLYSEILADSIVYLKECFQRLEHYKIYDDKRSFPPEDECVFYAFSRINEALLLNFQADKSDHTASEISLEEYQSFWEEIGLEIYEPKEFHPFCCEIYKVQECMGQVLPELTDSRWPCLMFGDLLFSRASVGIRADSGCINKQIAEDSTLYWSHIREDRRCDDLSHGWGGNSQWKTAFRFDYWSGEDLYYHVNHGGYIFEDDEMPFMQRLEILRYRCFVLTPEVQDCFPYNYFFQEKYKTRR